jgi:putative ABC transport system permease protein
MVWTLFGAVSLVLLIGCVNVANLLLVRSGERSRSMAVQAAFGATPADLLRTSIVEGLVLGAMGGMIGLLVAWVGVCTLRQVLPAGFPRLDDIALDPSVLTFTAVVALAAAVLFSLVPALRTMSLDVSSVLQDSSRGASLGRRSRRIADAMVAAEVGLALVLMLAAGLLLRSYQELAQVDVGYRTEGVVAVAIELPPSRYAGGALQAAFFDELMGRMRQVQGIEAVGAVSYLPMSPIGTEFDMPFSVEGLEAVSPSQRPTAEYRGVIRGYFEAMDIDLLSGRMIDDLDGTDGLRVALVNATVVRRYFTGRDPVGQMINMPMAGDVEIIGVVEDIRHDGVQAEANTEIFVPYVQLPLSAMHVVIYTEQDPTLAVNAVRAAVREIDPQQPITRVNLIEDLISDSIAPSRFSMALLLALATCAAFLAVVGVYGVVRYSVSLRTRELGVRMALGADSGTAVRMVLGHAGRIVMLGIFGGLLASVASATIIEGMLYGVEPLDSFTFATAAVVLASVAMAAAALPAMRAARIDPVRALRED